MIVPGVSPGTGVGEQLPGLGLVRVQGKLERHRTVEDLPGVRDQSSARTLPSSLRVPLHNPLRCLLTEKRQWGPGKMKKVILGFRPSRGPGSHSSGTPLSTNTTSRRLACPEHTQVF